MDRDAALGRILRSLQDLAEVSLDIDAFADSRYSELFEEHGVSVPPEAADDLGQWQEVAVGITHLAQELRTAVKRGDNDLLFTLGVTASVRNHEVAQAQAEGRAPEAPTAGDDSAAEHAVYAWYSPEDQWCFLVPELGICERQHLQPGAISTFARRAVEDATGHEARVVVHELPTPPIVDRDRPDAR
ncbi:hypothetical protein GCM10022261_01500 [Brevibacterium daeguense]|uniref:Uncharacterized protein n=1 Tax=Brevibacterium daeguense TaxID=909936 RepID=A0ABP8EFD8_9MICO|nr:hypothetical protein [Brevibacterium daeguense]